MCVYWLMKPHTVTADSSHLTAFADVSSWGAGHLFTRWIKVGKNGL